MLQTFLEDDFDNHLALHHFYCFACQRFFQNQNNLNQHLNSGLHKQKDYLCPGRNCGRKFVSLAALVLHFESGTCRSGLDRRQLNELVVRQDRNNVITNPSRLIAGSGGVRPSPVSRTWATQRSWNGYAYECFLCNREFRALDSLNRHLQSPIHDAKIYRCPNRICSMEYSALSALTQHVENGGCGVNRFKEVKDVMDSLTKNLRAIAL
ncbi:hypothetical protein Clacol_000179 [Clathrus columnatus]|uniref:C2H2-type domain-containing protein n=1 Tax=Clathrus columnatus TaxID=1419009 RepID=A0AAV4ZXY8_9AGAM|nr:hypothetical protein Clacol_000179 [Clathrus columnatus]